MSVLLNPDCNDGKHRSCSGDGWDEAADELSPCPCECHGGPVGAEHFPSCPCGACQTIRAARPDPPPPIAFQSCCWEIVRLTRTGPGTFTGQEVHRPTCPDTGATFLPETKETT